MVSINLYPSTSEWERRQITGQWYRAMTLLRVPQSLCKPIALPILKQGNRRYIRIISRCAYQISFAVERIIGSTILNKSLSSDPVKNSQIIRNKADRERYHAWLEKAWSYQSRPTSERKKPRIKRIRSLVKHAISWKLAMKSTLVAVLHDWGIFGLHLWFYAYLHNEVWSTCASKFSGNIEL